MDLASSLAIVSAMWILMGSRVAEDPTRRQVMLLVLMVTLAVAAWKAVEEWKRA